jgi:hypothetical protein
MTTRTTKQKAWTKPQVKRLGKIKDIHGASGSGTQGGKS